MFPSKRVTQILAFRTQSHWSAQPSGKTLRPAFLIVSTSFLVNLFDSIAVDRWHPVFFQERVFNCCERFPRITLQ